MSQSKQAIQPCDARNVDQLQALRFLPRLRDELPLKSPNVIYVPKSGTQLQ